MSAKKLNATEPASSIPGAVFDTNILISGSRWAGNEAKLIDLVEDGKAKLYVSPAILEELRGVLMRPKFELTESEVLEIVEHIVAISTIIEPLEEINVVENDPPDNRIIECAVEAKADYVVSGDRDLLNLKEFRGIKIIKARELLRLLGE